MVNRLPRPKSLSPSERIADGSPSADVAARRSGRTIRSLEALRGLSIAVVFLFHTVKCPNMLLLVGMVVTYFFMLSGLALSMTYGRAIDDGSFLYKNFIRRRILRICPLYYFSLFVFLYVMLPIGWTTVSDSLPAFFMVQSLIPGQNFSGIAIGWFASALMLFYLLFPAMYRLVFGMSMRKLAVFAAVLTALSALYTVLIPARATNAWLYAFGPARLVDCFAGIVVWRLYLRAAARPAPSLERRMRGLAAALTLGLLAAYALWMLLCPGKEIFAVCYFLPVGGLIFLCAYSETLMPRPVGLVRALAASPVLTALGAISFEIYFLHAVVRCKYRTTLFFRGWELDLFADLLVCVALTLLAVLCWRKVSGAVVTAISGIYKKKCATSR